MSSLMDHASRGGWRGSRTGPLCTPEFVAWIAPKVVRRYRLPQDPPFGSVSLFKLPPRSQDPPFGSVSFSAKTHIPLKIPEILLLLAR